MNNVEEGTTPTITGINVTPLVDITLVLLIVFLVTARMITSSAQTLPFDVPRVSSPPGTTQTILSFTIDDQGKIALDGRRLEDDAYLVAAIRQATGRDKDLRAVLHVSEHARHGVVVHVMDVLRSEGVTRIGFGVKPK